MAALPRGMEHFSREELYTSLPTRIQYLKTYLDFGEDDVLALVQGQPYFKMLMPGIVDMVYRKLLQCDLTARVFRNRDSRSEVDPEVWPEQNSTAIQNRKIFLRWYFTKLTSEPTSMEYWEYLDKVGYMHTGRGRRNPLHVDYVFLGACLGNIQDSITEAILSQPKLDCQKKIAIVRAVGKVIWIQNDLLARWHCSDGEEYRTDRFESAQEGMEAHDTFDVTTKPSLPGLSSASSDERSIRSASSGKTSLGRIIEETEQPQSGRNILRNSSVCPFSGLILDEQRAESPRPLRRDIVDLRGRPQAIRQSSGGPRLKIVDGKTVCKEKLVSSPFGGRTDSGRAL
ncbi:Protoglobin [Teratosphaeria destructans]|uniref:Protoglobin n=1 Tax=Teratosphaeria destructans TaxID=418781 RepID=A0A9W7SK25_9PEZI|nr:Protoglobin [Teratosphaeria destructans]